jgi:hypothetical protein
MRQFLSTEVSEQCNAHTVNFNYFTDAKSLQQQLEEFIVKRCARSCSTAHHCCWWCAGVDADVVVSLTVAAGLASCTSVQL